MNRGGRKRKKGSSGGAAPADKNLQRLVFDASGKYPNLSRSNTSDIVDSLRRSHPDLRRINYRTISDQVERLIEQICNGTLACLSDDEAEPTTTTATPTASTASTTAGDSATPSDNTATANSADGSAPTSAPAESTSTPAESTASGESTTTPAEPTEAGSAAPASVMSTLESAPPAKKPKVESMINNSLMALYQNVTKDSKNKSAEDGDASEGASLSRSESKTKAPKGSAKKRKRRAAGSGPEFDENFAQGGSSEWSPEVVRPTLNYSDVGGIELILQDIRELIEYPLMHPEIYCHLGVDPPRGVLLHGPPGCGKTLLATATAGELKVPLLKISAPEIVSGMSGESEAKIRGMFQDAVRQAPCILFIDEIDAITPKRSTAQRSMDARIVSQLLTCMDNLSQAEDKTKHVIIIGATNRPDALDPALRRAGRFDREIAIGIPDEDARAHILQALCRNMRVEEDLNFKLITKKTVGYVGADLSALTREAAVLAVNRIFRELFTDKAAVKERLASSGVQPEAKLVGPASLLPPTKPDPSNGPPPSPALTPEADLLVRAAASDGLKAHQGGKALTPEQLAPLCITLKDFLKAIEKVQPSAKREGFATIPDVTWADIGALEELREELNMTILQPIKNRKQFEAIGLSVPAGVLLYGPPGCGKTLVAKAIASESGASFLSIKGPELLNQYVGASERAVRDVFERARSSSPCVIFFDELDALCPKRGFSTEGSQVSERVVNQLLTEMDGLEGRKQVFVIAATNRPDIIDPAMLRPGRLDKLLYIKLPKPEDRVSIMRKHLRKTPLQAGFDWEAVAKDPRATGFSGADVASLVREASLQSLKSAQTKLLSGLGTSDAASIIEDQVINIEVGKEHFDYAYTKVFPSVSAKSSRRYDRMYDTLRKARSTLQEEKAEAAPKTEGSEEGEGAAKEPADSTNGQGGAMESPAPGAMQSPAPVDVKTESAAGHVPSTLSI